MTEKPIEILMIEDNAGDVILTREAMLKNKIFNNVNVAEDGEEAWMYLKKTGKYENVKTPDLILLDLNIPIISGHDVLIKIKEDAVLKKIPVVIFSSSKNNKDVAKTYENHANCYVNKPIDFEQFKEIIGHINNFWFEIVLLPNKED